MIIDKPGYYEGIPMHVYLQDPCPEPALSSGIVEALWRTTPQKARAEHPRLSPGIVDLSPRADIGSAVHAYAHGGYPVVFGAWENWRTDASKAFRDAARAENAIPLLDGDRLGVETAGSAVKMALSLLGPGKHEVTMIFQYRGVWFRCRADWLSDGPVSIPSMDIDAPNGIDNDTKTVKEADAYAWIKSTLFSGKLDVQMAIRHLGHIALTGKPRKMIWTLAEYERPYDTDFVGATEQVIELGIRKINYAADLWRKCLDTKKWPAKERRVKWANPPAWAEWELLSRNIP